jgi:hypothetical protein
MVVFYGDPPDVPQIKVGRRWEHQVTTDRSIALVRQSPPLSSAVQLCPRASLHWSTIVHS